MGERRTRPYKKQEQKVRTFLRYVCEKEKLPPIDVEIKSFNDLFGAPSKYLMTYSGKRAKILILPSAYRKFGFGAVCHELAHHIQMTKWKSKNPFSEKEHERVFKLGRKLMRKYRDVWITLVGGENAR